MGKGEEIIDYKNMVINDILYNKNDETLSNDIVMAINPQYINDRRKLIHKHIFPYPRVPNTQTETCSYLTITVDMPKVSTKNYFFKDMLITVRVIVHQDLMEMPQEFSANRSDYIGSLINKILNQNKNYGNTPLEYVSDVEGVLLDKFFTREIRFRCNELNKVRC